MMPNDVSKHGSRPVGRPPHDNRMAFAYIEALKRFHDRPLSWVFKATGIVSLIEADGSVQRRPLPKGTARRRYYKSRKSHLMQRGDGTQVLDPAIEQLIGFMLEQLRGQKEGPITAH